MAKGESLRGKVGEESDTKVRSKTIQMLLDLVTPGCSFIKLPQVFTLNRKSQPADSRWSLTFSVLVIYGESALYRTCQFLCQWETSG